MKNNIAVKLGIIGLALFATFSNLYASEVSGTLTAGTSTDQTFSAQSTNTSSGGGGGGGGSIVMPSASYSYGGNVSYATNPVILNSNNTSPSANSNISTTGNTGEVKGAYTYRPLAQAGLYNTSADINAEIGTSSASSTTATVTDPVVSNDDIVVAPTETDQVGPYDFFGISVWFWLVLLVLLILIIAVLYMQSL